RLLGRFVFLREIRLAGMLDPPFFGGGDADSLGVAVAVAASDVEPAFFVEAHRVRLGDVVEAQGLPGAAVASYPGKQRGEWPGCHDGTPSSEGTVPAVLTL